MAKETLYPHIPKPQLTVEDEAIREAINKQADLQGQYFKGEISGLKFTTEAEKIWRVAMSLIIQKRSK
jgi:hypothetical protein